MPLQLQNNNKIILLSSGAIDIMATLLEEARNKYGEASIETAPAYFEYGNALFRESQRQIINMQSHEAAADEEEQDNADETDDDKKPAATRQEEESQKEDTPGTDNNNNSNNNKEESDADNQNEEEAGMDEQGEPEADEDDDDDDAQLALDMMETAFAVLDNYVQSAAVAASDDNDTSFPYLSWAQREYLPRFLTNIGDVLSTLDRHADAADVYTRELQCREDNRKRYNNNNNNNNTDDDVSLQQVIDSRKVAEANILVAEELLACPEGQDVVTTETQSVLVEASEVVSYVTGYYEKARDQLQETVYLMGKVAGKVKSGSAGVTKEAFDMEKENVCFASTLLMGVGEKLAEHDEQQKQAAESAEPAKKKAKK